MTLTLGRGAALEGAVERGSTGAHVPLTLVEGRVQAGSPESKPVSGVTAYCNACHGESAAGGEDGAVSHAGSAGIDHPVDVAYPQEDPAYRPAGELDPAVLLLDGQITCVACHAHDDPSHGLVLPAAGSALCRACHLR